MSSLSDYIIQYDNVITKQTCDYLISLYDQSEKTHMKTEGYDFCEVNMMNSEIFEDVRWKFVDLMQGISHKYSSQLDFFPQTSILEEPRIKRYEPKTGVFKWHCDATNNQTNKRILVMFFYLNDVEEGGETKFRFESTGEEISVKPKAGSVVCFPPTWQYPHMGCTPISGPKYVISSYAQL